MSPLRTLTLGHLARASGLARSSLLHYEALGLLQPQSRSEAGYRLYGEEELRRLQTIRHYRQAGLSLQEIGMLLQQRLAADGPAALLEKRLLALCDEMQHLREQQKGLARLLAMPEFHKQRQARSKSTWVALLRQAGFNDDDMRDWHAAFELGAPEQHAAFLRSLGMSRKEAAAIRRVAIEFGLAVTNAAKKG